MKQTIIKWFREAAPYINAHRGKTFVIFISGQTIQSSGFRKIMHDIALLLGLGIKIVIIHGARNQIDCQIINDLRVTNDACLALTKQTVASIRLDIEAILSMGLANTPMAGAKIRIISGNFITARPLGVRDGIDYIHTGLVRKIDSVGIKKQLAADYCVLLSPVGFSPAGQMFNINSEDVATATAIELAADKYIILDENCNLIDKSSSNIIDLTTAEAQEMLAQNKLNSALKRNMKSAIEACDNGVKQAHLIDSTLDGALLQELFSCNGMSLMISASHYEKTRDATPSDIPGILDIIRPLEEKDILVKRPRDQLEMEIDNFIVLERGNNIIGVSALYEYPQEKIAEVACVAIHPDYQEQGRGEKLLKHVETLAKKHGITQLFVLSTQTTHWFLERGYKPADPAKLPFSKQKSYNYQRNSKVFVKKHEMDIAATY